MRSHTGAIQPLYVDPAAPRAHGFSRRHALRLALDRLEKLHGHTYAASAERLSGKQLLERLERSIPRPLAESPSAALRADRSRPTACCSLRAQLDATELGVRAVLDRQSSSGSSTAHTQPLARSSNDSGSRSTTTFRSASRVRRSGRSERRGSRDDSVGILEGCTTMATIVRPVEPRGAIRHRMVAGVAARMASDASIRPPPDAAPDRQPLRPSRSSLDAYCWAAIAAVARDDARLHTAQIPGPATLSGRRGASPSSTIRSVARSSPRTRSDGHHRRQQQPQRERPACRIVPTACSSS